VDERDLDSALWKMRCDGSSILNAIKFVRAEQGIDLGEAKSLVSHHPAYRDVHQANVPLHDELSGYVDAGLLSDPASLMERVCAECGGPASEELLLTDTSISFPALGRELSADSPTRCCLQIFVCETDGVTFARWLDRPDEPLRRFDRQGFRWTD
jgi:hypothetical protein